MRIKVSALTVAPLQRSLLWVVTLCALSLILWLSLLSQHHRVFMYIDHLKNPGTARSRHICTSPADAKDIMYNKMHLPSGKFSKFTMINNSQEFKVGDVINVRLDLYNWLKQPMRRGGDVVLMWMTTSRNRAASAGSVVDHKNGSYTGHLRAFFSGHVVIKCAIACSKEGFDLMYQYFADNGLSKRIMCIFEAKKKTEITTGSPFVPKEERFCNMTAENYGIPWYCVKPENTALHCSDWTRVSHDAINISYIRTKKANFTTYSRAVMHQELKQKLNVTVIGRAGRILQPDVSCKEEAQRSWTTESPVGFFYNSTWYPSHCQIVPRRSYKDCFHNRRTVLFGDSTVRQWFVYLFNKLQLRFKTESWKETKWHHQTVAYKPDGKSEIVWAHHGLPIYFGEINRGETRPIHVTLDEIPPHSNHTILIHLYAHFLYSHPRAYRQNLVRIVSSLKSLFLRAPKVKVAVKGSHYFSYRDRKTLGGMWGPVYDKMLKEEFRDIYDKVFFIDIWDMTVAKENRDVHPDSVLVKAMVTSFVDYFCE